ncbi:MAG: DUF4276 family protein [Nannocystaceae bacterium]
MSGVYLCVLVEGRTELNFAKNVLAPYLASSRVWVHPQQVLTSRARRGRPAYRGGLSSYARTRSDLQVWMRQRASDQVRFSTIFDLYGLPKDFPGLTAAPPEPYARVGAIEAAMAKDIDDARLIPYVQLHEFEALVLADVNRLGEEYFEHSRALQSLASDLLSLNPELINDSPNTAPSKRILASIPEYNKSGTGVDLVKSIGVDALRKRCRHFGAWVTKLEDLGR